MATNCTIEYLPNIRQLYVLIPIIIDNINVNTKLYLNRDKKTLHTSSEDDQSSLLISVPGLLNIQELAVPIENALESLPHVHRIDNVVIVQFRNVTCSGIHGSLKPLPCAKELQNDCKNISCSNCGNSLISLESSQFTFKDLPNEHWLELLDCWSCHDNEFAPIAERALNRDCNKDHSDHNDESYSDHSECTHKTSNRSYHDMNNSNSGLILPSAGKIYLGTSYILMNQTDFNSEKCPNCNVDLGESIPKTENIKIYRDLIKFSGFPEESFLKILMHRILDTIDNHSTFHFILATSKEAEQIYLRPIHWSLQVYDPQTRKWRIAFKLGYSLNCSQNKTEAEIIKCTSKQFAQIQEHLKNCHENILYKSCMKIPGSDLLKLSYLIE